MTLSELSTKIIKHSERDPITECWNWKRAINASGYGILSTGHFHLAHRAAYEAFVAPIPEGLSIDHLCRNTICVNPAHLEAIPIRENILRGNAPAAINARKTHCKAGHPLAAENLYRAPSGRRACRICKSAYHRKYMPLYKLRSAA